MSGGKYWLCPKYCNQRVCVYVSKKPKEWINHLLKKNSRNKHSRVLQEVS